MSGRERWTLVAADSSPTMRYALLKVLSSEHFISYEAGTLEQATDALKVANGISIVLLDLALCSGPGIAESIKQLQDVSRKVKVVIITHRPVAKLKPMIAQLSDVSILRKPFRLHALRRAVSSALSVAENKLVLRTETVQKGFESQFEGGSGVLTPQLAGDATFDLLFKELERRQPLEEGMDAFDVVEKHLIERALTACGDNQSRTARFLGITRNTLRKRIKKYGFSGVLVDED